MDIDKCVIESLDGDDIDLLPFIPYILQDIREIGADPKEINHLIKNNIQNIKELKVVDLGCGKGAISVAIAKAFGCTVYGIDAIPQFIDSAKEYAKEQGVEQLCRFIVGDIRLLVSELCSYDIAVLGAIGSVFGNEYDTFSKVRKVLNPRGYLIIDHGYLPNGSSLNYEKCCFQSDFYKHIEHAGFEIIEERIMVSDNIEESNTVIFNAIEKRVNELIQKFPEHQKILNEYITAQKDENKILENELDCGTWLLKLL